MSYCWQPECNFHLSSGIWYQEQSKPGQIKAFRNQQSFQPRSALTARGKKIPFDRDVDGGDGHSFTFGIFELSVFSLNREAPGGARGLGVQ